MNPILVALDLDTADAALAMASKVRGQVGGLKVGSHLFTSEGPALVRALVERGDRITTFRTRSPAPWARRRRWACGCSMSTPAVG